MFDDNSNDEYENENKKKYRNEKRWKTKKKKFLISRHWLNDKFEKYCGPIYIFIAWEDLGVELYILCEQDGTFFFLFFIYFSAS